MSQRRWPCAGCRYQASLTAGTVLHNTKTPLTVWFWAVYLTVTDKRGISALLLQRQVGLRRYETAWMVLHKLRCAVVSAVREPLHGDVEIDDTWVGGPQPGLRGSRQLKGRKAAIVLVAVEKRGNVSNRIRMAVVPDFKHDAKIGASGADHPVFLDAEALVELALEDLVGLARAGGEDFHDKIRGAAHVRVGQDRGALTGDVEDVRFHCVPRGLAIVLTVRTAEPQRCILMSWR